MRSYQLLRDDRRCTVVISEGSWRTALPPLVLDSNAPWRILSVAIIILLDYFDGESDCELKARLLARGLVRVLNKLGDRWTLTRAQLDDSIMRILVEQKETVDWEARNCCIEIVAAFGKR